MIGFLASHYDWLKALHVISVIFWMAGLLYLPRLFVYQIEATEKHGGPGGELAEALKSHQRLLLKRIMNAAMIATWVFGLLLLWVNSSLLSFGWMHAKLLCVVLMTGAHIYFARTRRLLESDQDVGGSKRWRLINEVPALLAIIIVIMAVAEPF